MDTSKVSNARRLILGKTATLALALAPSLSTIFPPGAVAQGRDIDFVAREIIKRDLQLQSLNLRLHQQCADPNFNRSRRTWLWDFGNAIPTEAGLITATANFYSHYAYRQGNHLPNSQAAAAIDPQVAGQVVGGLGSYFELMSALHHSIQTHKKGLDFKVASKRVLILKNEIDVLQAEYDSLTISGTQSRAYLAEAAILKDIRDNSLNEFIRLQKSSAFISSGQVTEDAISALRNTIGCTGNSINVAADLKGNKRLNGQADILNLIAASMITTRPLITNMAALLATHHRQNKVVKTIHLLDGDRLQSQTNDFDKDFKTLSDTTSATAGDAQLGQRMALYKLQLETETEQKSLADYEQSKLKLSAARRFRETIYGPTKLSQSVLGIVVGLRSQNNATKDYQLAASGNVTYTSGQIFNIFELVRERIVDEDSHSRLQAKKMLPAQRLQKSAERLEEMQKLLEQ